MAHFFHSVPHDVWLFLGLAAVCFFGWKLLALTFKSLVRIILLAILLYAAWRGYHWLR